MSGEVLPVAEKLYITSCAEYVLLMMVLVFVCLSMVVCLKDDSQLFNSHLDYLMNIPTDISNVEDNKELVPIFWFVNEFVADLYGKRFIRKWLKSNKGKTILDLVTMSDIAYCLTLVENNCEVWDEMHLISTLSPEEQKKWKNPKNLSPDERKNYIKKQPRFTSKKGRKFQYKKYGMNDEGVNRYNAKWAAWKALAKHNVSWEKLQEAWIEFSRKTGVGQQWVERSALAPLDIEEEAEEAPPSNRFSLPGDADFEQDRAGVIDMDHGVSSNKRSKRANDSEYSSSSGGDSDDDNDDDDSM